jgi:hypothetical protein
VHPAVAERLALQESLWREEIMPTRPVLLHLNELRTDKSIRSKRVAIHLSQKELDALTAGLKPQPVVSPLGQGLQIIPIPGQAGYVAFPRCMPGEVPLIDKDGNVRCIPETGCAWGIDASGSFACTGTCTGGTRCERRLHLIEAGFFLSCS